MWTGCLVLARVWGGSGAERMAERPYLSIEDVARRFGVTPSTVYRLAQRGILPAFKVGSDWRFDVEAIDRWRLEQTAEVQAPPAPKRAKPKPKPRSR